MVTIRLVGFFQITAVGTRATVRRCIQSFDEVLFSGFKLMQFTGKFIIFLNVLASTEQEVLDQQDFQFTDGPTYGYVHGGWVLKACELSIQCIYILFGEADHTLDVPQLEVNQKEKITMQLQSFPTNT